MNMRRNHKTPKRESGAALILALIFLLVMTVLGTSSMRTSSMQERMAGNMRDGNLGFQSAETGLRAAESFLLNAATLPEFNNAGGYYTVNSPDRPVWTGDVTGDGNGYVAYEGNVEGVAERPKYYIERLSSIRPAGADTETGAPVEEVFFFRITAVGYGAAADDNGDPLSSAVLSSVYRSR
jgi:type IV pilus assembly protein PilX